MRKQNNAPAQKTKKQYRKWLLTVIFIIAAANYLGSFYFTRIDLTSDKRFTLAGVTKNVLKQLDERLVCTVYLKGDFPAGFKRLEIQTREILEEFQAYNKNVRFIFVNPSASGNLKKREHFYRRLVNIGLNPTNLQVKTKNGLEQQYIPSSVTKAEKYLLNC